MSTMTSTRPASAKQIAFIRALIADRQGHENPSHSTTVQSATDIINGGSPTSLQASQMIDMLKAIPRTSRPVDAAEALTDGMYLHNGEVFKVQRAVHGSGNLYAKRLVVETTVEDAWNGMEWEQVDVSEARFEYAPGAVRRLRPRDKMSLEQAATFGSVYGVCCVCAATLTNEESIAAGIGPVCAGRL